MSKIARRQLRVIPLRCDLAPLDLYVAHTSPIVNAFMKRLLPLLEPTRNDPVLHRFPNFREVWG